MEFNQNLKEIVIVLFAVIILGVSVSFWDISLLSVSLVSFLIIIGSNVITKKITGYFLEIGVDIKFWEWYQYGFRQASHFKKPVPMLWLPMVLSFFSRGYLWWLGILEFDVSPKVERASRRHGLYRFTEVTEWHVAWIAIWGIVVNIILGIIGYVAGFEIFAKLSIYYSAWAIIPLSSLDGSKIFFSSRKLWVVVSVIVLILTFWVMTIV
jgi:hypothetical protein